MVRLTRLDGTSFVVNCDIIQFIEATPDTIITLTTKEKLMVKESVDEVIEQVIDFKRKIFRGDLEFERDENEDSYE